MNKSSIFCFLVFVMLTFAFSSTSSLANGKGGHDHDHGMSAHMQAMYELKDKVPSDYQIMERTPIVPDQESLQNGTNIFQNLKGIWMNY